MLVVGRGNAKAGKILATATLHEEISEQTFSLNEKEALCKVSRCVQKSGSESTDEEIMIWFCLFKSLSELPQ